MSSEVSDALSIFGAWYDAHETADLQALAAVLDQDVTVHSLFRDRPVRGRADAVAHFQGTLSAFPNLAMVIVGGPASAGDGVVLAEVEFRGGFDGELSWKGEVCRGTGQRFAVPGAALVHVAEATVTQVRTLFARSVWLSQIGLSE